MRRAIVIGGSIGGLFAGGMLVRPPRPVLVPRPGSGGPSSVIGQRAEEYG